MAVARREPPVWAVTGCSTGGADAALREPAAEVHGVESRGAPRDRHVPRVPLGHDRSCQGGARPLPACARSLSAHASMHGACLTPPACLPMMHANRGRRRIRITIRRVHVTRTHGTCSGTDTSNSGQPDSSRRPACHRLSGCWRGCGMTLIGIHG